MAKSAALPPAYRAPFVNGFREAAASGSLTGGSGSAQGRAPGTSPSLAAQLQRLGHDVFAQGYVLAMRWTMVMPIAVVLLAAVSCLALKNGVGTPPVPAADGGASQMAGTISSSGPAGNSPGSSSGTMS